MKRNFFILALCLMGLSPVAFATSPRNVIFMIGDGMGIPHVYAAMVANGNHLELERCKKIGFSKTYSSDRFITDSAAGGTALSSGVKTRNGMIGMGPDSVAVETLLEMAEKKGLATGIVVTCAVTHATPASYIAHQVSRNMYEEIAADYLKTDVDVFIGGGRKYFEDRADQRNLITELKDKKYQVAYTLDDVKKVKTDKLAGLLYDDHAPAAPARGNYLPEATTAAIDILNNNHKGFFMMIEGSQIDWGGHDNNTEWIINETLDFDKTIGAVLNYAAKDKNTLVVITADHETGGMTLLSGDMQEKVVKGTYSTKGHSAVVVPVYAFGPGAEEFTGFMENTDIEHKIEKLMKLEK